MRTLLSLCFAILVGVGSLTTVKTQQPVVQVYKSPT